MKLTAAIAHSYPNADVKFMDIDNVVKVAKMDGIVKDTIHLGIPCDLIRLPIEHRFISAEYCQLILTPLSKISDEDAVEVAKIAIGVDAKEPIIERCGDVRVSMDYGISRTICVIRKAANQYEHGREYFYVHNETEQGAFNTSVFGTAKIVDYLRSKGYDCGHGLIPSLIAAGVAVEKTNL